MPTTILEDFEDQDLSEYAGQTSEFEISSNHPYNGSYDLRFAASSGAGAIYSESGLPAYPAEGGVYSYRLWIADVNIPEGLAVGIGVESVDTNGFVDAGYEAEVNWEDSQFRLVKNGSTTLDSASVSVSRSEWYELRIDYRALTAGTITVDLIDTTGTTVATVSTTDTQYSGSILTFQGMTTGSEGRGYFDYIVRFDPPETPSGVSASASGNDITVSWKDVSEEDGYRVYRAQASGGPYSEVADVGANTTEWMDTGLTAGERYYYVVTAYNQYGESEDSSEATAVTDLPAPSDVAQTIDSATAITVAFTDNSSTEDGFRVEKNVDGTGWVHAGDLAANTTSQQFTVSGEADTFQWRVRAETEDTASDWATSGTVSTNVSGPTVDATRETAVDLSWMAVDQADEYYVYRATESGDTIGDYTEVAAVTSGTTTYTDTGLDPDTTYYYRVAANYGSSTDEPSSETTATTQPLVSGVTAANPTTTSLDVSWVDESSLETEFEVARQREYDHGWGPWETIVTLAANTTTFTDSELSPGNTYRYRVTASGDGVVDESDPSAPATTTSSGQPRTRTGSRGWHVEIDHPSGRTLRPQLLDDPQFTPVLKDLPRVEIPVPRADKWESDTFDGAPMRVWKDGHRLPITELRTISREPDRVILQGAGGLALDQHLAGVQFDERDSHLAAKDVLEDDLGLTANVDDPATNTRGDVLMQSADFGSEFQEELSNPSYPFPDDFPLELFGPNPRPEQTGWFREAEATESNAATYIASEEGNPGAWSGGQALRFRSFGEEATFSFTTGYDIPQGEAELIMVHANPDVSPELRFYISPNQGSEQHVATLPEDFFVQHDDEFDLRPFGLTLNPDSTLPAGTHEVRVHTNSDVADGVYPDFFFVHDARYPYQEDTTPVDGVVEGWWQYPTLDLVFKSVSSVEQVVGGRAAIEVSDTSNDQAVALRNGTNDWVEATNTDEIVVESFADGEQSIQLRVTLGGADTGSASGDFRAAPQELDSVSVWASLADTPVLLDKYYRGRGMDVVNRIAETGPFIWEARWKNGGIVIEWTQPGQRTTNRELDYVSFKGQRTVEESYQRIIVAGESKSVVDERFQQDAYGVLRGLAEERIQTGSETVYDVGDPDTVYERNVDYAMDWHEGAIELLDGGSMATNTEYAIDYTWKVEGEYTLPGVEDPRTREVQLPEASTGREADQFARGIVKDVQEPLEEVTATITGADPRWSLVEALGSLGLPFEGPLEVRGLTQQPGQVEVRLGTRQSVGEVVDELRSRIDAVAREV